MDNDKTETFETKGVECDKTAPPTDDIDDATSVIRRAAIRTIIQQQAEAKKKKSKWVRFKEWVQLKRRGSSRYPKGR